MVGVVQSVEHQIVILGVVGSSPIIHPIFRNIYFGENLRKKSIILSPGLTFWGFFLPETALRICMIKFLYLIALLLIQSCATTTNPFSYEKYKAENPWADEVNYAEIRKKNPEDRYIKLSDEAIKNIRKGYPNLPWIESMVENLNDTNPYKKKIHKSIKELPLEIKNLFSKKVFAWSVVKNLGSSGLALQIYNNDNRVTGTVIVIDESIFQDPNNFLTRKEASVYKSGHYAIKVKQSGPRPLSPELYLLLHEMGHAVDSENIFTAGGATTYARQSDLTWYPFTRQSWKWDGQDSLTPKEGSLKDWAKTRKYYSKNIELDKIENSLIPLQFYQWKDTNFPSPYATSNIIEDWAESFVSVILKKYYKTDLIYSLYKENLEIMSQASCVSTGACKEKFLIIENFIETPDIFSTE